MAEKMTGILFFLTCENLAMSTQPWLSACEFIFMQMVAHCECQSDVRATFRCTGAEGAGYSDWGVMALIYSLNPNALEEAHHAR